MAAAGQVESVTVMRYQNGRSKGCAIVKYVTPEEAQHAITALNDVEVDGRRLLVREDREGPEGPAPGTKPASPRAPRGGMGGGSASPRGGRGGSRGGARSGGGGGGEGAASPRTRQTPSENAVYVGNLPWSVTWANLKDMFSPYGATYAGACVCVSFTYGAARQLCAAGGSLPARAFISFLSSHITTRMRTLFVFRYQDGQVQPQQGVGHCQVQHPGGGPGGHCGHEWQRLRGAGNGGSAGQRRRFQGGGGDVLEPFRRLSASDGQCVIIIFFTRIE